MSRRVWLIEIDDQGDDECALLPEWRRTKDEAVRYMIEYRARYLVDAPMRVVRFDEPRTTQAQGDSK